MSLTGSFLGNLDEWVKMQKKMLETVKKVEEELKKSDRLDLIVATRTAFQHIMKTIKAFDQWLQDPIIISHMPREYLVEVQERVWRILEELLELDIEHTSKFKEHMEKLIREGKVNPLLWAKPSESEEEISRRRRIGTII